MADEGRKADERALGSVDSTGLTGTGVDAPVDAGIVSPPDAAGLDGSSLLDGTGFDVTGEFH